MSKSNLTILNSAASNLGPWVDISLYGSDWSLHATGMESGSSLNIYISNSSTPPVNVGTTVAPGAFLLANQNQSNGSTFFSGAVVTNWLCVQKVQGGSPTRTSVNLFGLVNT